MKNMLLRAFVMMQSLAASVALVLASLPDLLLETPKVIALVIGAVAVFLDIVLLRHLTQPRAETKLGDILWGFQIVAGAFAALALAGSFVDAKLLLMALCWGGVSLALRAARSAYEVRPQGT